MINKKPTIQMVADKAGVSRGTVDRVLNNRSHVSPDVYERVMAAIQETGYLTPRSTYQKTLFGQGFLPIKLGVLLPNWTGHFRWEIMRGIEAAQAELTDFHVKILVEECETDIPEESIEKLDALLEAGIQGAAVCTMNDPSIEEKIRSLTQKDIPVITFNSDLPGTDRLCFIGQDYNKSGRIAAELISKCIPSTGRILAAAGNLEFDGHRARLDGFCTRMSEIGFPRDQIQVIETYTNYQLTYKKVLSALQEDPAIKAIYMANRSVAGCTKAVETAQKKGEIRIICHDMSEHTKSLLLDGTIDFSISQDLHRQGYLPLIYLRDYLHKQKLPPTQDTAANISILCSQNL